MRCQQVQELLPQYADGVIPLSAYRAMKVHLQSCHCCQELYALYGQKLQPSTSPSPEQLAIYMQHLEVRLAQGLARPETRRYAQVSHERSRVSWRPATVFLVGATTGCFLLLTTAQNEPEHLTSAGAASRMVAERSPLSPPSQGPLRLTYLPSPTPMMTEAAPSGLFYTLPQEQGHQVMLTPHLPSSMTGELHSPSPMTLSPPP